jgi:hypothetical protein
MMEQWEDWMFDVGGGVGGVATTPSRQLATQWTVGTYNAIS